MGTHCVNVSMEKMAAYSLNSSIQIAPRWGTVLRPGDYYTTLHYGVVWCGVVWCGETWRGVVWCDVV